MFYWLAHSAGVASVLTSNGVSGVLTAAISCNQGRWMQCLAMLVQVQTSCHPCSFP